jgi:hypothetical protein
MRHLACAAGVLCMMHFAARAQHLKSYIPPSPTAAGLGVYGQIPISEYSGVPDIKIPLHSIQAYDFTLPVSLSYHAAGFRYADEGSWIGLGWSLNCGGVITRSKRHKDDLAAGGFYQRAGNRPCGEDIDQEPDLFFFNVAGYTGKFIIDSASGGNLYTIKMFVKQNVKLEWNATLSYWTLTTGEGVKYRFEKRESTTETTVVPDKPAKTETFTSSWFVTSIELANNSKILYTYQPLTTKISRVFKSITEDKAVNWFPPQVSANCCMAAHTALQPISSTTTTTVITDEVTLAQIDYPTGRMVFTTSSRTDLPLAPGTAQGKKLDGIQVYTNFNGTAVYLKEYAFTYDYYNSGSGAAADRSTRLRLTSLTEKTKTASQKPHRFTYNSNSLPDKYNTAGYLGSQGLIASIVYPTGGTTVFSFGAHQAANAPAQGGARIEKIYNTDPDKRTDVKRFEYTGGIMMGKLYTSHMVTYTKSFIIDAECCNMAPPQLLFSYTRQVTFSSDFSSLGETVNGNVVGYDKVVTWYGENGENGKKESFFWNTPPADPNYIQGYLLVPVPLNVSSRNGLLKDEYEYSNNSGTYVMVRRINHTYTSVNAVNTKAMRWAFDKCAEWAYDITSDWMQHTSQTVYNYDLSGQNPVEVNTKYFYDDAGNAMPTRVITTDSKGSSVVTTNSYAKEKSTQLGGVYTIMLNRNMVSRIIDQDKSRNGSAFKKFTTYKDWYGNGRIIKPETEQQKIGGNAQEVLTRYHGYDESGNVLALSRDGGKVVSYSWGYNNLYPIAEVTNAEYVPKNELLTRPHNVGHFLPVTSSELSETEPFTTNYAQTYSFSVNVQFLGTGTTLNGIVNLRLTDNDGNMFFNKSYNSTGVYNETVTLPSGTNAYHFSTSGSAYSTGVQYVRCDITSNYTFNRIHQNYFHTSFEDLTSNFTSGGKTGKKCVTGPYYVIMPWNTGQYILSWWEKPRWNGDWAYKEQVLSITTTNRADLPIGNDALLIDEVRLYPVNAQMTTYTYEPGIGMATKCDERSRITYYEYDNLSRLKVVRDHEQNILKTIEYNFKN